MTLSDSEKIELITKILDDWNEYKLSLAIAMELIWEIIQEDRTAYP